MGRIKIRLFAGICFAVLFFPGANAWAGALADEGAPNSTEYVRYSYQVFLPGGMRKALAEYDPTFKLLTMEDFSEEIRYRSVGKFDDSPIRLWSNLTSFSAVFGNFNNDGIFDAAVLGEVAVSSGEVKYFPVLSILSEGATSYRVVELTRISAVKPLSVYLSVARNHAKPDVEDKLKKLPLIRKPAILDTILLYNGAGVTEY